MPEFVPCGPCLRGAHDQCTEGVCNCLEEHAQDDATMRGFKILKRAMDPSRPLEADKLAKLSDAMRAAILAHRQGRGRA